MLVKAVKLNDFRNYSNSVILFNDNLNIIVGQNGIGKTNILESLILISNTKSFRVNDDKELILKGKEFSKVEVISDEGNFKVVINETGKSLFINNIPIKRTSEFIGKLNCILFKPSDLELFSLSPKERRRILDIEVGKVDKTYLLSLLKYNVLLKDKNKILKDEKIDDVYLNSINEMMIKEMEIIISKRIVFFEVINKYINDYYHLISNTNDHIEVIYDKCSEIKDIKDNIYKTSDKDKFYHYTTYGIHHEDYHFKFNDYDLNSIASQGQKRMVMISFKLALMKYVELIIHKKPIILLDDILSELDVNNRKRLLDMIPKDSQVIITTTDINGLKIDKEYNLIQIKEEK